MAHGFNRERVCVDRGAARGSNHHEVEGEKNSICVESCVISAMLSSQVFTPTSHAHIAHFTRKTREEPQGQCHSA